ncbi:hypothetical protein niasHT_032231 [Heterodera trifolii]|uniref:Uncharacterized protein n=1 Tax=Heterodera trifolii TaxID=157864 RepID=A0ABD2HV34_9BILA
MSGDILEIFLLTFRTTPSENLNGKCPAELFLGRRPRIALDLLRPPIRPTEKDLKMEAQFNRKHGARFRSYNVGDQVFARHKKGEDWRAGKISERNGVIYTVQFTDNSTGRFHANQLHAYMIKGAIGDEDIPHPLDVLNDTFGLPILEPPPIAVQAAEPVQLPQINDVPLPPDEPIRRYPARQRKSAVRLDIADPRRPKYDYVPIRARK